MSHSDVEKPMYYPEDYDYSIYYQDKHQSYGETTPTPPTSDFHFARSKKPVVLPTINYFNERKCPIYIHRLRRDSSVYNNYGQKFITSRKSAENQKVAPQNASKFVLDKLEETYWATWKPKKDNLPVKKKSSRKVSNIGFPDNKPLFQIHNKGSIKHPNKPHGDIKETTFKYFKSTDCESSSTTAILEPESDGKKIGSTTTASVINEKANNKSNKKPIRPQKFKRVTQKDSVSQEIQTEVHCPVILQEIYENKNSFEVIFEKSVEEALEENGEVVSKEKTNKGNENEFETKKQQEKKIKQETKVMKSEKKIKKHLKISKKSKKDTDKNIQEKPNVGVEKESLENTFVALKDSIEIAKEKQEISGSKPHYQQPKCIRLFRKSGTISSHIKGGTYPLKSCLKKDSFPKGNFRLGAPGSPLFITTSSFSNRGRK